MTAHPSRADDRRDMLETIQGLDAPARERIAALRAQGRFLWLDASFGETSREALVDALDLPCSALRSLNGGNDARASRAFSSDGASIAFALHCYVEEDSRLKPLQVQVIVTADYLVTL